jgi:hypothetical protein
MSAPISTGENVAEDIATAATQAQIAKNSSTRNVPIAIGLVISPTPTTPVTNRTIVFSGVPAVAREPSPHFRCRQLGMNTQGRDAEELSPCAAAAFERGRL